MMTFFQELEQIALLIDSLVLEQENNQLKSNQTKTGQSQADQSQPDQSQDQILTNLGQSNEVKCIQRQFQLSPKPLFILLLAILPTLVPKYRYYYAQLQQQEKLTLPSLNFLLDLVSKNPEEKTLLSNHLLQKYSLLHWELLQMVDSQEPNPLLRGVFPAPDLLHYCMGYFQPDRDTNDCLQKLEAPEHKIVEYSEVREVSLIPLIQLYGEEGVGRQTQAYWLAQQKEAALYEIDNQKLWEFTDPYLILRNLFIFLSLHQASLYWPEGLQALADRPKAARILGKWLKAGSHSIYFSSTTLQPWPTNLISFDTYNLSLQLPSLEQSQQLWQSFSKIYLKLKTHPFFYRAGKLQKNPLFLQIDWKEVSSHYHISPKFMLQVCLQFKQELEGGPPLFLTQEGATKRFLSICLDQSSQSLGNFAIRVIPQYQLEDLVLSPQTQEQFHDLEQSFRLRHTFQKKNSFSSQGICALFWGPPGTGKTRAAEVLAHQLQLPLYKVDLANLASKWIGETEKHLAQLFDNAERNNAILFFDEADAIFVKRTKVESNQDKNANMGMSFLLQRIETYQSLLILATNFRSNIDRAIFRRLDFSLEFPLPPPSERLKLWQGAWEKDTELHPEISLEQLSRLFPFSGANIHAIAQQAMLLAKIENTISISSKIEKKHLSKAIQREAEKMDDYSSIEYSLNQWRC